MYSDIFFIPVTHSRVRTPAFILGMSPSLRCKHTERGEKTRTLIMLKRSASLRRALNVQTHTKRSSSRAEQGVKSIFEVELFGWNGT